MRRSTRRHGDSESRLWPTLGDVYVFRKRVRVSHRRRDGSERRFYRRAEVRRQGERFGRRRGRLVVIVIAIV